MRKISKLLHATTLLLVACLFFSCDNTEKEPELISKAVVQLIRCSESQNSITVSFQPSENTVKWEYAIGATDDLHAFEQGTLENIQTEQGNTPKEVTFENLQPGTTYTVFARAYDNAEISGGVSTLKYPTDDSFQIEQQYVLSTSAAFTITFSNSIYKCRYYLGKSGDKEAFLNDTLEGDSVVSERAVYTANIFNLQENTDYVFYAIGYDRYNVTGELIEMPVKTLNGNSSPKATFERTDDSDPYTGRYLVTYENASKAVVYIGTPGAQDIMINSDAHWRGDIVAMLESWAGTGFNVEISENGEPLTLEQQTIELVPDKAVEAYILFYGADGKPAGVNHYQAVNCNFDPNAQEAQVTIEIPEDGITTTGATFIFEADENTWAFLYNTLDADWYDELVNTPEYHEYYIHELLLSGGQFFAYQPTAPVEYIEATGEPGKRYYAVACPMNRNGAKGWGKIVLKEFTTKSE